jgi:hypothetical protein
MATKHELVRFMLLDDSQVKLAKLLTNDCDIEELIQQSSLEVIIKNGLSALVITKAREFNKNIENSLLLSRLSLFNKQLEAIHAFQKQVFDTVFEELDKQNIVFIILKGWSLAYSVYEMPFERPKTDIDILIKTSDREKAKLLFLELGFENPRGWEPQAIIDQFSMQKRLTQGVFVNVDIHLELVNDKLLQPIFNWQFVNNNKIKNNALGYWAVNKKLALLHAIVHMLGHANQGDFIKLIWFYDIILLIKHLNGAERTEFLDIVNSVGLAKVFRTTFIQLQSLFPYKEIDFYIAELQPLESDAKFIYLIGEPSKIKALIRRIKKTKGLRNKTKIVKEVVFPPKQEIFLKYGKNTKCPLWFLYIRRIIFGIKKYIF